jgi:CheY-like chemotaxis protein
MDEEKTLTEELDDEVYDSADRPFDFVGADEQTAIVCDSDEGRRENICKVLKEMDYQITEASSSKDALRNMRYHAYDLIVVHETFDMEDGDDENNVLIYLNSLSMPVRRNIFVVLLSNRYRTTDNMAAFNKSVNMIINTQSLDDLENVMNRGIAINAVFYNVFKEVQRRVGRI